MMPEPDDRLCWTCAHRYVCYVKRDAVAAVETFRQTMRLSENMAVKGTVDYEIEKCEEYAEEHNDGT